MIVGFDPNMPPALVPLIEELFEQLRILVPPQVHNVHFNWHPDSGAGMSCDHDQAYRIMRIGITPGTFEASANPLRYLCHELAHWFNAPIADAAEAAIKDIIGPEYPTPGSRVAKTYLDDVTEAANTDLEQAFLRILERAG